MKVQRIFLQIGWSVGVFGLAIYCLFLFPSPAFDACLQGKGDFACGRWPDLLSGFSFVFVSYLLGPRKNFHYVVLFGVFIILGSLENIRFGSLIDAIYQIPFQEFYYGGFSAIVLFLVFHILSKKWQNVPNK